MITLTEKQLAGLLEEVKSELVQSLIVAHKDEFDFITPAQAGGLLDISAQTLAKIKLPRYVLAAKSVVRYKLSEVLAHIKASRE